MHIAGIQRTTGFRVAILLLALLSVALLTGFSLLYVDTARFMTRHVDDWLRREQASLLAMDPRFLPHHLQRHAQFDTGSAWPVALYDPSGRQLAGEAIPLPANVPQLGSPFVFRAPSMGRLRRFRGIVERLQDGDILLISERLWWASSLDHVLIGRAIWGLGIASVMGLATAAMLGVKAQRRISVFSSVAVRIADGDLSGRLPVHKQFDDLDRLAHVVNGMLDHIERMVQQIATFRDAVAHDLSAPLTRLHVTLEGLHAKAVSRQDDQDGIHIALQESRYLAGMLAAVRRLSEIESGVRRSGFAPVRLYAIALKAFEFYQPIAEERGIRLEFRSCDRECIIVGDPDLLVEAIGNLLDNALKFTPADGLVRLSVFNGDAPGIEVSDTGPGIPAAEQEAVLRRFYRPQDSRSFAGSGLGLALVSAIADLHGMKLTIRSTAPGCNISLRRFRRSEEFRTDLLACND